MKIPFSLSKSAAHKSLPGMRPSRDWKILLSASATLVLAGFAGSAYLFFAAGAVAPGAAAASPAAASHPLDPKAISSVIAAYGGAPGRVQNIVSGGELLVDPSR